jgi:hypothetical protein
MLKANIAALPDYGESSLMPFITTLLQPTQLAVDCKSMAGLPAGDEFSGNGCSGPRQFIKMRNRAFSEGA